MARELVTADNYGPLVLILSLLFCIIQVLSTLTRHLTKFLFHRKLALDDLTSTIATAIGVAQTITETVRVRNGLGKHVATLTQQNITTILKLSYVSEILYILLLFFSEVSILLLLKSLTPDRQHWFVLHIFGGVILTWAVVNVIVAAAQCSPAPWYLTSTHCINASAWWNALEISNFLINFFLVVMPLPIIFKLRIKPHQKYSLAIMFSLRLTVCAAIISRIVYWEKGFPFPDLTFDTWIITVTFQIVECFSIVTYSALFLKPFFAAFETGFIRSDELRRRGQLSFTESIGLSKISDSSKATTHHSRVSRITGNLASTQGDSTLAVNSAEEAGLAQIVRRDSIEVTSTHDEDFIEGGSPVYSDHFPYPRASSTL